MSAPSPSAPDRIAGLMADDLAATADVPALVSALHERGWTLSQITQYLGAAVGQCALRGTRHAPPQTEGDGELTLYPDCGTRRRGLPIVRVDPSAISGLMAGGTK